MGPRVVGFRKLGFGGVRVVGVRKLGLEGVRALGFLGSRKVDYNQHSHGVSVRGVCCLHLEHRP